MTEHQKARRARKSAEFFAARARAAAAQGDAKEARRLAEWSARKGGERLQAEALQARPMAVEPGFHQRIMRALDRVQTSGRSLPAHGAIRRAVREANMSGRQFKSLEELARAVARFSPHVLEEVKAALAA